MEFESGFAGYIVKVHPFASGFSSVEEAGGYFERGWGIQFTI